MGRIMVTKALPGSASMEDIADSLIHYRNTRCRMVSVERSNGRTDMQHKGTAGIIFGVSGHNHRGSC